MADRKIYILGQDGLLWFDTVKPTVSMGDEYIDEDGETYRYFGPAETLDDAMVYARGYMEREEDIELFYQVMSLVFARLEEINA